MAEQAEAKFQIRNATSVGGGGDDPISQSYRRARHLQQDKSSFVREIPLNNIGKEGDIVYYKNPSNYNKVEQYLKNKGEWINLSIGRPLSDSTRVKKFIKAKTG
jgi:hypothetical protein